MRNKRGFLWIDLGLLLIAAALFLAVYNLYDGRRAGQSAQSAADQLAALLPAETGPAAASAPLAETNEIEIPDYILNPDMEMPVVNIDGQDYIGILEIPALELTLPVIGSWSYPSLKLAPCRYGGSAYSGNLIIAGHNYSSHFGQLKNLKEGETVLFTDMDGNVFLYQVMVRETLPPSAADEMENGGWDLTLFTCTVGGQSRLTIRCTRAGT